MWGAPWGTLELALGAASAQGRALSGLHPFCFILVQCVNHALKVYNKRRVGS